MDGTRFSKPVVQRAALIVILLIGAGMRLMGMGDMPPGLYSDEAQHGLDATAILNGDLKFYFPANNGREPLFIYLVAATQAMIGPSPLAVRLPSAFIGILTLAAMYALAKALWHHRAAMYATAMLAGTFWHVHLSRIGYRAVLLPLFTALMLAFAARAIRTSKRKWWILAGVAYGLSWYTYMAARFTPVALLAIVVVAWLGYREQAKRHWKGFVLFCVAAFLVLLPLGVYTLMHPDIVLARTGQVSIFSAEINGGQPLRMLFSQIVRALGMFFIKGDRIWRHNLAWRPVWGAVMGVLFVVGAITLLRRLDIDFSAVVIVLWVAVMLLPTILAEDCPHFLRGVGILPVVVLIPAVGLLIFEDRLTSFPRQFHGVLLLIPWLIILGNAASTMLAYQRYSETDLTYYWLEGGVVELAGQINSVRGEGWDGERYLHNPDVTGEVYVDEGLWNKWKTLRYLNGDDINVGMPVQSLDPSVPSAVVVWPYQEWEASVLPHLPHPAYIDIRQGPLIQNDLDPASFSLATIIESRPVPDVPEPIATFANGMVLHAALDDFFETPGVDLYWKSLQPMVTDYVVFVHLMRGDSRVTQHDSAPGLGHLNTTLWQPGDLILDRHPFGDVEILHGEYTFRIGIYDPVTGESVSVVDAQGNEIAPWYTSNNLEVVPLQ